MHTRRLAMVCILAVFAGMVTSGCITVGRNFYSDDLSWIVQDQTTRTDVQKVLGEPFRVGLDSGRLSWTYGYYKYRLFGATRTKDLVVYFNRDGTIHSYTFSTSFPAEKKNWESRNAP